MNFLDVVFLLSKHNQKERIPSSFVGESPEVPSQSNTENDDDFRHSFFIYPKFTEEFFYYSIQDDKEYLQKMIESKFLCSLEDGIAILKDEITEFVRTNTYVGEYWDADSIIIYSKDKNSGRLHLSTTEIFKNKEITFQDVIKMIERLVANKNLTAEETAKGINGIELRLLKYGVDHICPYPYVENPLFQPPESLEVLKEYGDAKCLISTNSFGFSIDIKREDGSIEPCVKKFHCWPSWKYNPLDSSDRFLLYKACEKDEERRKRMNMEKACIAMIIIDMQEDFVNGPLGSIAAKAIVGNVSIAIDTILEIDPEAKLIATQDSHSNDTYLDTREGIYLPVKHCILNTKGWEIVPEIRNKLESLKYNIIRKEDFGSQDWQGLLPDDIGTIVLVGLCTDICVVTNALILRTVYPDARIITLSDCCAGTSQEAHEAALLTMKSCQIEVMTLEEFNKGGYENNILLLNNEDKED